MSFFIENHRAVLLQLIVVLAQRMAIIFLATSAGYEQSCRNLSKAPLGLLPVMRPAKFSMLSILSQDIESAAWSFYGQINIAFLSTKVCH
jgi:hypothetical protein